MNSDGKGTRDFHVYSFQLNYPTDQTPNVRSNNTYCAFHELSHLSALYIKLFKFPMIKPTNQHQTIRKYKKRIHFEVLHEHFHKLKKYFP